MMHKPKPSDSHYWIRLATYLSSFVCQNWCRTVFCKLILQLLDCEHLPMAFNILI